MVGSLLVLTPAPNHNSSGRRSRTRTTKRSRRSGGDSVGKYFGDAWSLAKRTANGLNEIRKLINVEHKYIETNIVSNSGWNGTVTYLSGNSQGNDINSRDGDSIRVLHLFLKGCVFRDPDSVVNESVRFIIFRDLQNNGTAPTGAELLSTVGSVMAPYQPMNGINGPNYNNRFTIVYDRLFSIQASDQLKSFEFEDSTPRHIIYRGTGATTASAGNGSYWSAVFSNTNSDFPTVNFVARITYTDN
jgi:hypothetical protein